MDHPIQRAIGRVDIHSQKGSRYAASIVSSSLVEWRALRDLEVGVCDGLSYKQIQVTFLKIPTRQIN